MDPGLVTGEDFSTSLINILFFHYAKFTTKFTNSLKKQDGRKCFFNVDRKAEIILPDEEVDDFIMYKYGIKTAIYSDSHNVNVRKLNNNGVYDYNSVALEE